MAPLASVRLPLACAPLLGPNPCAQIIANHAHVRGAVRSCVRVACAVIERTDPPPTVRRHTGALLLRWHGISYALRRRVVPQPHWTLAAV